MGNKNIKKIQLKDLGRVNKSDYYEAPDCSVICESGSGSPKTNGTQECSCSEFTHGTLSTVCWTEFFRGKYCGFDSSKTKGEFIDRTYRGSAIDHFYSRANANATYIAFDPALSNLNQITIRINGIDYIFKKNANYNNPKLFIYSGVIFNENGTYKIEFID